jgi:hypothetical protein
MYIYIHVYVHRLELLEELHEAKELSMQKEHDLELISLQAEEEKRLLVKVFTCI